MNIAVMAGVLLLAIPSLSSAADLGTASNKKQPHFDWSGPYIGAHIGYGWGESNFVDSEYNGAPPFFPTVKWGTHSDGLLGGINAGYNWQRGNMVFGLEGEIGRLNLSGNRLQPGVDPFGDPYDASGTVGKGWYGGLSARVGYTLKRTLLYGKAGVVYSDSKLGFVDTCTEAPCGNSTTDASERVGWGYQLGVGAEHALTNNWTVKVEYVYLDFGSSTIRGRGVGGGFDGMAYNIHSDLSAQTIKVGVNYKF